MNEPFYIVEITTTTYDRGADNEMRHVTHSETETFRANNMESLHSQIEEHIRDYETAGDAWYSRSVSVGDIYTVTASTPYVRSVTV